MSIITLLYNKIQLLSISSSLVGKSKVLHASADIPVDDTTQFDVDRWAFVLKQALNKIPEAKFGKGTRLILAQRFFKFSRIEIPTDVQETAMEQFLKTELVKKFEDFQQDSYYKFFLSEIKGKKIANIFFLPKTTLNSVKTLLSFYNIKVSEIYPEAVLIFHLFEHTLNKKKEESALFLEYEKNISTGLLFDSAGLLKEKQITVNSDNIKKELKQLKLEETSNIARLILGGNLSKEIRQDSFTKETTIWTNPLEKVLEHSSYKNFAGKINLANEVLQFCRELSLLKLIENKSEKNYALPIKANNTNPFNPLTSQKYKKLNFAKYVKILFFALLSFSLTLLVINYGIANFKNIKLPTLPKINISKLSPTPAPQIKKEEIDLSILNGVGTAGLAGKAKTKFTALGYTVGEVGNADSYDYEITTVIATDKNVFNIIKKDLKTLGSINPKFEKSDSESTTIIVGEDLNLD
jgi:hypothetical protein